jgi:hypothetical protein
MHFLVAFEINMENHKIKASTAEIKATHIFGFYLHRVVAH